MANDNLSFSQRHGHKRVKVNIQMKSMDDDLRNSLWSITIEYALQHPSRIYISEHFELRELLGLLWFSFFKKPLDQLNDWWPKTYDEIRTFFFSCSWYEVYDFIEFIGRSHPNAQAKSSFVAGCNNVLERELSGYRFVGDKIAPITSETEIAEIQQALQRAPSPVALHLKAGLDHYANRESPDYRNSVKESISAVEAMCSLIVGKGKPTLGEALKQIQAKAPVQLHPCLSDAFDKLYGYTNDADGIRHAGLNESTLDSEDAKFMLVSCSAFINYLKVKASKAGLKLSDS